MWMPSKSWSTHCVVQQNKVWQGSKPASLRSMRGMSIERARGNRVLQLCKLPWDWGGNCQRIASSDDVCFSGA